MATAGPAVKLRRLRRHFGIGAPKVAVKTHVAWYWRALASVVLFSISLAGAIWVYDAGRRFAGFDSRESLREIEALQEHVFELESELGKLRSLAGASGSRLQLERSTQQELVQQVKALELENARLMHDLGFFEGLVPDADGGEPGIKINRLRIEPDGAPERFRYRMLLVHSGGKQVKEFRGSLQLLVKVQQGGKDAMIAIPSGGDPSLQRFGFEIKHFRRLDGVFSVPSGAVVKSVEARLLQDGAVRARQTVNL